VAGCIVAAGILEHMFAGPPGKEVAIWAAGGEKLLYLSVAGKLTTCGGYMPVVPMVVGSCVCVVVGSLLTRPPGRGTIEKYFGGVRSQEPVARSQ
jgi:hypothetical protein